MLYATLKILHLLAVVVWVGGMVFAHFFLRPAVAVLPAAQRLPLMHAVLGRFFGAVVWAAGLTLLSGAWMMARVTHRSADSGAQVNLPLEWTVMAALGVVMMLVFAYIRLTLYPALTRQVSASDWANGALTLHAIRRWVLLNLTLALLIVVVTLAGVSL